MRSRRPQEPHGGAPGGDQAERLGRQLVLSSSGPTYSAHLRLRGPSGEFDVLLGHDTRSRRVEATGVLCVDWTRSPYTELYLGSREGETFALIRNGATVKGVVLERNRVRFVRGELVEVSNEHGVLVRGEGGAFEPRVPPPLWLASDRTPRPRRRSSSLVDVRLDPAQRGAVELPPDRSMLILGEAGRGKTTVALHRLAYLARLRTVSERFRAVVIVPAEGLRRLVSRALVELGVDVPVLLYEEWARSQAQRVFGDLPSRESTDATAGVLRMKRHAALRVAIEQLALRRARIPRPRGLGRGRVGALARRDDLLHLFGDRALVGEMLARCQPPIPVAALEEILEHTHVQFSKTTEQEYSHVIDPKRLVAVDHRALDDGTPMNDAGTIDSEDYAVLFELDRVRAAQRGAPDSVPRLYDCIVLDEAQELARLELALVGRSLAEGGVLVVAGDAEQHTDPHAHFAGWGDAMQELGMTEFEEVVLGIDYRCPPPIASLARWVRRSEGDPAGSPSEVEREDGPVWLGFDDELHLVERLAQEIAALRRRRRRASIALVCRTALTARRIAGLVRSATPVRLVLEGEFPAGHGTFVTTVEQSKGLEFDYVLLPDASESSYPDDAASRRALYVALTRARDQVLLLGVGRPARSLVGAPVRRWAAYA